VFARAVRGSAVPCLMVALAGARAVDSVVRSDRPPATKATTALGGLAVKVLVTALQYTVVVRGSLGLCAGCEWRIPSVVCRRADGALRNRGAYLPPVT
jgi:hypothetical protein